MYQQHIASTCFTTQNIKHKIYLQLVWLELSVFQLNCEVQHISKFIRVRKKQLIKQVVRAVICNCFFFFAYKNCSMGAIVLTAGLFYRIYLEQKLYYGGSYINSQSSRLQVSVFTFLLVKIVTCHRDSNISSQLGCTYVFQDF